MADLDNATSQRVTLGSGSGIEAGGCPETVHTVSKVSKYRTIVVDPPWPMPKTGATTRGETDTKGVYTAKGGRQVDGTWWGRHRGGAVELPYETMTIDQIRRLPIRGLVAPEGAHLYLWTTNRFLEESYTVARGWGFRPAQLLVWCKPPMGVGFGGYFTTTTEFVLFCSCGSMPRQYERRRMDSSWWEWSRPYENGHIAHSAKPDAFLDTVEQVSPEPRIELFARRQRLGWDTWGDQALEHVDLGGQSEDTDPLQTRSGSQSA